MVAMAQKIKKYTRWNTNDKRDHSNYSKVEKRLVGGRGTLDTEIIYEKLLIHTWHLKTPERLKNS